MFNQGYIQLKIMQDLQSSVNRIYIPRIHRQSYITARQKLMGLIL